MNGSGTTSEVCYYFFTFELWGVYNTGDEPCQMAQHVIPIDMQAQSRYSILDKWKVERRWGKRDRNQQVMARMKPRHFIDQYKSQGDAQNECQDK
jgi:hypothetical protein